MPEAQRISSAYEKLDKQNPPSRNSKEREADKKGELVWHGLHAVGEEGDACLAALREGEKSAARAILNEEMREEKWGEMIVALLSTRDGSSI